MLKNAIFCTVFVLSGMLFGLASTPVWAADPFADITLSPSAKSYLVLKDVNVRAGPKTKSKRVGRLRRKEFVKAVGRAKGTEWIAIQKAGKNLGFVYGTALVPMMDGTLLKPVSGILKARTVAGRKLPFCRYKIQFEGKVKVEGDIQVTSDYKLALECNYKGKIIKIDATMFMTELPYLDNRKPIYQINVDLAEIQLTEEDQFSVIVLYNALKKVITFDGVNDKSLAVKGKVAAKKVANLRAILKGTVAMAHQSWSPKIWAELAKPKDR